MIEREERDATTVLRLAHGKANALDLELCEELTRQLGELESSPARAAVLTGTGSIFCAGVDLFRLLDGGEDYVARFVPALNGTLRKLFFLPKPVIVAINGHAIAGGCVLAAAADLRVMADGRGRIGVTELLVGVPFPTAVLEPLRFLVGNRLAQDLVYSGRTLSARDALAIGLVDDVAQPEAVLDRALQIAAELAAIPERSFAATKKQLRQPVAERIDRQAAELDREVESLWSAEDVRARIREYVDKTVRRRSEG